MIKLWRLGFIIGKNFLISFIMDFRVFLMKSIMDLECGVIVYIAVVIESKKRSFV